MSEHEKDKETSAMDKPFGPHHAHNPAFNEIEIIGRETNHRLRLLTESANIRCLAGLETIIVSKNDDVINRNSGALLPDTWLPVLKLPSS